MARLKAIFTLSLEKMAFSATGSEGSESPSEQRKKQLVGGKKMKQMTEFGKSSDPPSGLDFQKEFRCISYPPFLSYAGSIWFMLFAAKY